MDVEDFTRKVKPHHKRSKLQKFETEIRDLKRQGYSDMQVRNWLEENGIKVSRQNVQKYIARHLADLNQVEGAAPSTMPAHPGGGPAGGHQAPAEIKPVEQAASGADPHESPAERIRRQAEEQRSDAEKTRFKHDKTGNNH